VALVGNAYCTTAPVELAPEIAPTAVMNDDGDAEAPRAKQPPRSS
jgi:hypothetical protein